MNLLFDLDGTLFDPLLSIGKSLIHAFKKNGLPLPHPEQIRAAIGPPLQESFIQIFGAPPEMAKQLLQDYREHHAENLIHDYSVYPGTQEFLASVKSEHSLYVATSKPQVYAHQLLDHHGLSEYFLTIYGAELDGTRGKKGELIRYILAQETLDTKATWMIGDRKHDIIGAKENRLYSVGVLWGYGSREEMQACGADKVVEDWDGMARLLSDL